MFSIKQWNFEGKKSEFYFVDGFDSCCMAEKKKRFFLKKIKSIFFVVEIRTYSTYMYIKTLLHFYYQFTLSNLSKWKKIYNLNFPCNIRGNKIHFMATLYVAASYKMTTWIYLHIHARKLLTKIQMKINFLTKLHFFSPLHRYVFLYTILYVPKI